VIFEAFDTQIYRTSHRGVRNVNVNIEHGFNDGDNIQSTYNAGYRRNMNQVIFEISNAAPKF